MEIPDLPTILLALTTLLASYLSLQCFTPPNPTPNSAIPDRITPFTSPKFILVRRLSVILVGVHHALLVLNPVSPSYLLCPNPASMNLSLFTWTRHSAICLLLIIIFAPIRLLAYAQLGKNFTFKLARPQSLVTTGLYAYVQHPSYSANVIVVAANVLLFERPDCLAGCWMSEGVAKSAWWSVAGWGLAVAAVYAASVRVADEERMLKEAFGKEWEVWHQKTKRFVPGVF
ncbi:isoprenylcysteine carboxyl methyltransferase [Cadophora sp. MPI-SDFR-AT-0126]|nr:isoprenylcysteine carboxyl methyltransferase [Leotiomycetes sp. MPI-SDFR-AT-0126]